MTIADLKARGLILLECISGSRAYGLATPASDTDIKGVFALPKKAFYGLRSLPQVSNESNDEVYYELSRFVELLALNNPNLLELLNTPEQHVLSRHPLIDRLRPEHFLSKLCGQTFGNYALSQIKKARGLNKKILNPVAPERKTPLDFCFVHTTQGAMPLRKYLAEKGWDQQNCGLVNIPNMKGLYQLYHGAGLGYQGIAREGSDELCLSSVAKGTPYDALLYFNLEGYSSYCREYREYWDWVGKRNDARYRNTLRHGKGYDAKNMMHTFRLLDMAIEIAREGRVNVHRPNRDFLLKIKSGAIAYDDLLRMAEEKQAEMDEAFAASALPERPDPDLMDELAFELRDRLYQQHAFGSMA